MAAVHSFAVHLIAMSIIACMGELVKRTSKQGSKIYLATRPVTLQAVKKHLGHQGGISIYMWTRRHLRRCSRFSRTLLDSQSTSRTSLTLLRHTRL
jgi:hypothetical protein